MFVSHSPLGGFLRRYHQSDTDIRLLQKAGPLECKLHKTLLVDCSKGFESPRGFWRGTRRAGVRVMSGARTSLHNLLGKQMMSPRVLSRSGLTMPPADNDFFVCIEVHSIVGAPPQ